MAVPCVSGPFKRVVKEWGLASRGQVMPHRVGESPSALSDRAVGRNLLRAGCLVLVLALCAIPARSPASMAALALDAGGCVYYVAPDGDDSNPGSRQAPWVTPGYASRQLQPGDTLIIRDGRYVLSRYDEDIVIPASGSPGAWITIKGEEGGERPVLAGRDNLAMAVSLAGVSHVRLENLEITHDSGAVGDGRFFRDGISLLGRPASRLVLKNLYIHHLDEFGLNAQDIEHVELIDCRIEYCGFGSVGGPAGESGGWRDVVIDGCELSYSGHYYRGGDGSARPYDRPDGFGVEPSAGPIEIRNSVAQHNRGDGLDLKTANSVIRRCIIANNSCDGVKLWGDNSRVENCVIYGRGDGDDTETPWASVVIGTETREARFELVNVTVDDMLGGYSMYVQYDNPDLPISLSMKNCIVRGMGPNSRVFIRGIVALTAEDNLFYAPESPSVLIHGDTEYTAAQIEDLGHGNVYGDPLFLAPAWGTEGDYHLESGSPAIDAGGVEGAPAVDLDGRVRDSKPDIGAYEYPLELPRLALSVEGHGSTTPAPGVHSYQWGTNVSIAAVETDGCWSFSHWSGDLSGSEPVVTLRMDGDRDATAHFQPKTTPIVGYNLTLVEGWNLISLPVRPRDAAIEAVLSGLSEPESLVCVWAYDSGSCAGDGWLGYVRRGPAALTEMKDGMGYWLNMRDSATLCVNGTAVGGCDDPTPGYGLRAGWNLVGLSALTSLAPSDYLYSVAGSYATVWGFDADHFLVFPSPPGTGEMCPGHGYWIWMSEDGLLVPPEA